MKIEDLGIHVQRGQCPGSDYHRLKSVEYGLHSDRGIQTAEVQDGIQDGRRFVVERLHDDRESLRVRGDQRREMRH